MIAIATTHPLDRLALTHRTRKRAEYEAFTFVPTATGVRVRNESHADPDAHEYAVTVTDGVPTACTCPADAHGETACKHRVAVAIRPPVLRVATDPAADPIGHDAAQVPVSDGPGRESGAAVPTTATDGTDDDAAAADEPAPPDCDCDALGGAFPCWACVRTGRRSLPERDDDPDGDPAADA